MRKDILLALLDKLLDDKIRQVKDELAPIRGEKGSRGLRGPIGKPFDLEDNKEEIFSHIQSYINEIQEQLKLKLSDLSEEELNSLKIDPEEAKNTIECYVEERLDDLKLKFSDLSEEERSSLTVVGPRGQRGKQGRGFEPEEVKSTLESVVEERLEDIKLKFSDLTDEEKDSLAIVGPRGQRGKQGREFDLEENLEEINKVISELIDSKEDRLKLKFADLSKEEIDELRMTFKCLTDEDKEELKLKFSDLSDDDKDSLKIRGPRGQRGKTIKGEDGSTWHTGCGEPTIPANFGDYYLESDTGSIYKYTEQWEAYTSIMGPRGPRGTVGLTGLTGVGINGVDGLDGLDAPKIVSIELKKVGKTKMYFLFIFDDGSKIETDRVNLPEAVNAMAILNNGGGGGRDPYLNRDFVAQTNNYTDNKVTSIDYYNNAAKAATDRRGRTELTFTGNKVTQEDFYLYGGDGTTETRHIRYTYTYTGNRLAGSLVVDL